MNLRRIARAGKCRCTRPITLAEAIWLVAVGTLAFSCSESAFDAPPEDIGQTRAAATPAGDACGSTCGSGTLQPGEACCRSGPESPYDTAEQCCTAQGLQQKHPIVNLSACPNRVPNAGHVPSFDRCSIPGWVPNSIQNFTGLFLPACRAHDVCYDTCGKNRGSCDSDFLETAIRACDRAFGTDRATRTRCRNRARAFYAGIRGGGQSFYANAQKQACDCCAGDEACAAERADVEVSVLALPPSIEVGESTRFQFYVANQGPGNATAVTLELAPSAGLQLGGVVFNLSSSTSAVCSAAGTGATCALGTLTPGATAIVEGSATANQPGQLTLTGRAATASTDPNAANDDATANVDADCPSALPAWNSSTAQCEACPSGTTWDGSTGQCSGSCATDWELVPRTALSLGPNGTGGSGLLATYDDGKVVAGEGPIWFGPHDAGNVPSWYPADRLADASAPVLWQSIWGIGSETLTGYILAPRTGAFELLVSCDDFCSIDVPGKLSVAADTWGGGSASGPVAADAGTWYPITLQFANRRGSNWFSFYQRCP